MRTPLAGRRALVTGASGGIGGAIALSLARAGAEPLVLVLDMNGGGPEIGATLIDGATMNSFPLTPAS